MSYCRLSECDVYAYDSDEGVQFYVAGGRRDLDRLCGTYYEAYQYAKALRNKHGLNVPSYAIESMRVDALEELVRDIFQESTLTRHIFAERVLETGVYSLDELRELGVEVGE